MDLGIVGFTIFYTYLFSKKNSSPYFDVYFIDISDYSFSSFD